MLILRPWGGKYKVIAGKRGEFSYILVKGRVGLIEELCNIIIL